MHESVNGLEAADLRLGASRQPFGIHRPSNQCSPSRQTVADALEQVRGILLTRNNRIIGIDFLNRTFAIDAHFESMLLGEPSKIFFRQHRPTPSVAGIPPARKLSRGKLPVPADRAPRPNLAHPFRRRHGVGTVPIQAKAATHGFTGDG